jgi:hypothetical protein
MTDMHQHCEELAQRIIIHEALDIMQRGEEDTGRTAVIDDDEVALLGTLLKPLGISAAVANAAQKEYLAFKKGESEGIERALKLGERNETYRRYHGLAYLLGHVAIPLSREEDRLFGMFTEAELGARKYLNELERRMASRGQTRGIQTFDYAGFTLGELAALVRIFEDGDYGEMYGFPIDDTHLPSDDIKHPLEVFVPILGAFKRKHYDGKPAGGFLFHDAGPSSTLLYSSFLSRAYQAELADKGELELDPKTAKAYAFTRSFLEPLLISAFEFGTDSVKEKVAEDMPKIMERDAIIHRAVETVLEHPGHASGKTDMVELKRLIMLRPAYEQVMADGVFSDSEHALMDYALERIGVRRQDTRDLVLGAVRDADTGKVISNDPGNLKTLYGSRFFLENLQR